MSKKHAAAAALEETRDRDALAADLGRLNEVAAGLGDRVVRYVDAGTDISVLLEIKSLGNAVMSPFAQGYGPGHADHQARRRRALVDAEQWRPAVVHRFGVILDALREAVGWLPYRAGDDRAPRWLLVVIQEVNTITHSGYGQVSDPAVQRFYAMERMQELLEAAGEPPVALLYHLYGPKDYVRDRLSLLMEGLADYLTANAGLVKATLPGLHADGRERLINDLGRLKLGNVFFDALFDAGIGPSKGTRKAVRAILQGAPADQLLAKGQEALDSGSAEQRRETVELLATLLGEPARELLTAHLETEKSKAVRDATSAALNRINAAPTTGAGSAGEDGDGMRAIDGSWIEVPPVPAPPADTPLSAEALDRIRALIAPFNVALAKHNAEQEAVHRERNWNWFRPQPAIEEDDAINCFLALVNGSVGDGRNPIYPMIAGSKEEQAAFAELFARPDFTTWHLLRLVQKEMGNWRTLFDVIEGPYLPARILRARFEQGLDVRMAAQMLAVLGTPADHAARGTLAHHFKASHLELDIPTAQLYFLDHLDLMEEALGLRPRSGDGELSDKAALQLLAWLPKVPERLLRPLLDLALGAGKQLRGPARVLLSTAAGIDDAILARLTDPKKEVRAAAAEWIAERSMKAAVPALRTALKKEKSEEGRAALLTALSRLGEDISDHFSQKALKAEAEKGLAKGASKSLAWFPFATVPPLKWKEGKAVDATVTQWWIVLADKLKDPGGNALFELYLDRLRPEDAERFGVFLLQAFIERDTTTCSETEALTAAKQSADQQQQWWQSWHQRNPNQAEKSPFNYEQAFAAAKAAKLREHIHSCSENKGILGLAVRAPGPDAGALVRRYLKDHGNKVNQSKALLVALARNPSPAAIQIVLSAANRLKQKTVQALAKELIDDIADRRGWTADELGDRTIPTAGFDESGEMELECGEGRLFRAVYRGDGKIDLLNPDGKIVKALPAPRDDADKEPVALAKKALANARKETKQAESLQQQRLYEAMCVERTWNPETWAAYLQRHPIAGRLCQQLVWVGLDADGKTTTSFRPLEDGTLSSHTDEMVSLSGLAALKLGHQAFLLPDDARAWAQHLKDYEVVPLFPQFGKTVLSAAGQSKDATLIEDRKGWMIDSFKLQSGATKLGYERGEVYDGGGFSDYVKRFAGIGVRAVIAFSGSYVGANQSFSCALHGLSFQRISGQGRRANKTLPLPEVPPVLLSEAWGDLHAIAATGTGFDPEWEKKSYF
jgi:hypothetical protein